MSVDAMTGVPSRGDAFIANHPPTVAPADLRRASAAPVQQSVEAR
jgi:hypothetical protein